MAGQTGSGFTTGETSLQIPFALKSYPCHETGEGVDESWIGKAVFPMGAFDVRRYGTLGQQAIIPADRLVEKPDNLDWAAASAIWVPYLTGYGVVTAGAVKPGDAVLLTAANSAVALAAIDILHALDALPLPVVRSRASADQLQALGIEKVFVSGEPDFAAQILEATAGRGADLAFDPIGGKALPQVTALMKDCGRVVLYGVLGGFTAELSVFDMLSKHLTVVGFEMRQVLPPSASHEAARTFILEHLKSGRFSPMVAQTSPLADFRQAFQALEQGGQIGRLVLDM